MKVCLLNNYRNNRLSYTNDITLPNFEHLSTTTTNNKISRIFNDRVLRAAPLLPVADLGHSSYLGRVRLGCLWRHGASGLPASATSAVGCGKQRSMDAGLAAPTGQPLPFLAVIFVDVYHQSVHVTMFARRIRRINWSVEFASSSASDCTRL